MKDYLRERMGDLARKMLNPGVDLNPALDAAKDVLRAAMEEADQGDSTEN